MANTKALPQFEFGKLAQKDGASAKPTISLQDMATKAVQSRNTALQGALNGSNTDSRDLLKYNQLTMNNNAGGIFSGNNRPPSPPKPHGPQLSGPEKLAMKGASIYANGSANPINIAGQMAFKNASIFNQAGCGCSSLANAYANAGTTISVCSGTSSNKISGWEKAAYILNSLGGGQVALQLGVGVLTSLFDNIGSAMSGLFEKDFGDLNSLGSDADSALERLRNGEEGAAEECEQLMQSYDNIVAEEVSALDSFQGQYDAVHQEYEQAMASVDEKTKQALKTAESDTLNKETAYAEAKGARETAEADLTRAKQQLASGSSLTSEQRTQLQTQISQLETRVAEAKAKEQEAKTALDRARAHEEEIHKQIEAQVEKPIKELKARLDKMKDQRSTLMQRVARARAEANSFKAKVRDAKGSTKSSVRTEA